MPTLSEHTRVIRTLYAHQPGAVKLGRRYGDALVCVRYRHDMTGRVRYTTVELVVDEAPVRKRKPDTGVVLIRIKRNEHRLRQRIKDHGGRWDEESLAWRMPRSTAKLLRLLPRAIDDR